MRDERPQAPAGSVVGDLAGREADFDAMSADELDAWIIANSPKLSSFPLHTHEWRLAFLRELYMQGYPALFEGVSHAWTLMERPKTARCTYVGLFAGTGGKGKKALYNFFHQMIADALAVSRHIPKIDDYPSLDAWNEAVHQQWTNEERAVEQVIQNYALLLVGRLPEPAPASGELIVGAWKDGLDEKSAAPLTNPPDREGPARRGTAGHPAPGPEEPGRPRSPRHLGTSPSHREEGASGAGR